MSLAPVQSPELVILERSLQGPDSPEDLYHGAHLECQLDSDEFVVAVCGQRMRWLDLGENIGLPDCEPCHTFPATCPLCGTSLTPSPL